MLVCLFRKENNICDRNGNLGQTNEELILLAYAYVAMLPSRFMFDFFFVGFCCCFFFSFLKYESLE